MAQTADYQLGSMDKLRIRVVEWQTAEGAVRDWSSISGDYVVGPSGSISMPFIGEMPAVGKTTAEIAAAIGEELQQKLGLPNRPDASVELAEFRPVFVSGDVQTPGKYPYDPQLTVLKAVSLAGGLRRSPRAGGDRDFINAQGSYAVLVAQRDGLVARRARLMAEADGKQEIDFPAELRKSAGRSEADRRRDRLHGRPRKAAAPPACRDRRSEAAAAERNRIARKEDRHAEPPGGTVAHRVAGHRQPQRPRAGRECACPVHRADHRRAGRQGARHADGVIARQAGHRQGDAGRDNPAERPRRRDRAGSPGG